MKKIIEELLQNNGGVCISIILPTGRRSFADRQQLPLQIKNAYRLVVEKLKAQGYREKAINIFRKRIEHAWEDGLPKRAKQYPPSFALFLGMDFYKLVALPFNFPLRVVVSHEFEIKELLYSENQAIDYHILVLNKQHVKLYNGHGTAVKEITDNHFPQEFNEDHQRDKPAYHALHMNDPSQVKSKRLEDFLHQVDKYMAPYKSLPLILVGADKNIGLYKKVSKHTKHIIGEVHSNHEKVSDRKLIADIWPALERYQESRGEALKRELTRKISQNHAVYGIEKVWDGVLQYAGKHLVVEKDFEYCGPIKSIYSRKFSLDEIRNFEKLSVKRAVKYLINRVVAQRGRVDFLLTNTLKQYGRIALIVHQH